MAPHPKEPGQETWCLPLEKIGKKTQKGWSKTPRLVVVDELPEGHPQHAGQFDERQQADVELAAFETGDKRAIHVGGQGELFLTHSASTTNPPQTGTDSAQERV